MLLRCLFADASVKQMARSRGIRVPHLVRISYSTTLFALVHMYQEYYMFTLGNQRNKKAFHSSLRYFGFVYQRAHSYGERMHVPPLCKNMVYKLYRSWYIYTKAGNVIKYLICNK